MLPENQLFYIDDPLAYVALACQKLTWNLREGCSRCWGSRWPNSKCWGPGGAQAAGAPSQLCLGSGWTDSEILGEEGGLQLVLEAILTGFFFAYCKLFGNLNQRVNWVLILATLQFCALHLWTHWHSGFVLLPFQIHDTSKSQSILKEV